MRSGRSGWQSCSSLFLSGLPEDPSDWLQTQTRSLSPPTADYRDSCKLCFLPCIESGTWPRGWTAHTQSAQHGSYPQRVQRLPAEHRRHRGGAAAPLPPGAEFGTHIPAAPIRDPRCYGIASGGLQRGDLITPDRLSPRGKNLRATAWCDLLHSSLLYCFHCVCSFTQTWGLCVNIYF